MLEQQAKEEVILAGNELAARGLVARTWGNVSCRIDENNFAITPSGIAYERLTPENIVVVDVHTLEHKGDVKPSSEKGIHAAAYRLDPRRQFCDSHTPDLRHLPQCGGGLRPCPRKRGGGSPRRQRCGGGLWPAGHEEAVRQRGKGPCRGQHGCFDGAPRRACHRGGPGNGVPAGRPAGGFMPARRMQNAHVRL